MKLNRIYNIFYVYTHTSKSKVGLTDSYVQPVKSMNSYIAEFRADITETMLLCMYRPTQLGQRIHIEAQ